MIGQRYWSLVLNIQKASSGQHASLNFVSPPADATWSTSGMTVQRSRTRRRWTSPLSWSACSWSCAAACWCSSTFSMTTWVRQMHIIDLNTYNNQCTLSKILTHVLLKKLLSQIHFYMSSRWIMVSFLSAQCLLLCGGWFASQVSL